MYTPSFPVTLTEAQAAYFAGIVDGEGTIGVTLSGDKRCCCYRPMMIVTNTSMALMDWIGKNLGGNGWAIWRQPLGNAKRVATWYFSRAQIKVVLPQIRPYLVIKAEQADLVAEMLRLGEQPRTDGRQVAMTAIYDGCRALNKRGRNL